MGAFLHQKLARQVSVYIVRGCVRQAVNTPHQKILNSRAASAVTKAKSFSAGITGMQEFTNIRRTFKSHGYLDRFLYRDYILLTDGQHIETTMSVNIGGCHEKHN